MSLGAAGSWPLRMSPRAAKDFDNLIKSHRDKVVKCLTTPIGTGKWKKLESKYDLWRMHVNHAVRLVVNVQRGVAYVWRILDRKDVYPTLDNQNPGLALTGITIEEFLMKSGAKQAAKHKNAAAKPEANGNGSGGGLAPPPSGAAAADDGESPRSPSHPLLNALSQYFGEYVRTDVDAILAIVEDRAEGFEGEILSLSESLAKLDAREGEIRATLATQLENAAGLARSHEGLSRGVEQLGSRIETLGEGLEAKTSSLGGEVTALARELDRRMAEIHAAWEEDRRNMCLGLGELGRQIELLSAEERSARTTTDGHDALLRRLEGELAESSARIEGLAAAVAGLNGELERLRTERSDRNTLRPLATLTALIRAAFSPNGAA